MDRSARSMLGAELAAALTTCWPQGASPAVRELIEGLVAAAEAGHTWVDLDEDTAAAVSTWSGAGPAGAGQLPLVVEGGQVALRRWWQLERRAAAALRRLASAPVGAPATAAGSPVPTPSADPDQARAIANALACPVSLVLGGPGTGKTWTAARLIEVWVRAAAGAAPRIALAAPTGKAAARLGESVARTLAAQGLELPPAVTLHALLGARADGGGWRHQRGAPLPADIVVVDEVSMVDLELMVRLLEAVPVGARLVLLGDPDQLAAVETGAVLATLRTMAQDGRLARNLPGLATVVLHTSHRYAAQGALGRLLAAVAAGDADGALSLLGAGAPDVEWIDDGAGEPRRLLRDLAGRLRDAWPESAAQPRIVALAATYAGALGVDAINAEAGRLTGRAGEAYVEGQPLLVVANDHASRLANGDLGRVVRTPAGWRVRFGTGPLARDLAPSRLPPARDAWAMTVHKAQGSEFDRVIVILPDPGSPLASREWLYTALSRARAGVTLVGGRLAFERAVTRTQTRRSRLAQRIAEEGADKPNANAGATP